MLDRADASSQSLFLFIFFLIAISVVAPVLLSNHPLTTLGAFLVVSLLFFFPGYAFSSFLRITDGLLALLISPVLGILTIVTAYDVAVRASAIRFFAVLASAGFCIGFLLFCRDFKRITRRESWESGDVYPVLAGTLTTLAIAPLYWRSGRFSGDRFAFYGPAGQDPLFHVTLLQRLLHHVPPDNFIVAGLRAPIYHYFDDLTLALILNVQRALHLGSSDVFDLYYRCYPTLLYFLLGVLAYYVGRQLTRKTIGGVLANLVVLGAGGLGPLLGILQSATHASRFEGVRAWLFSDWTIWNGADGILPLVHRPAHYHSLLISLAAIALLLQVPCSRRAWIAAGLLWGLMAGFNFTLAATFGFAAVVAAILCWVRKSKKNAFDVTYLAAFILVGSTPVILSMLFAGFRNPAPGFPFRGPNLEFTTGLWGWLLARVFPSVLVPIVALVAFPVMAYGIRLLGFSRLIRADLGGAQYRTFAMMLAISFVLSFIVGIFFPYKAEGGVAIIFIQPTLWILGLFSLVPITVWLENHKGSLWYVAVWTLLGLTWIQALGAFNFGRAAVFGRETVNAFQEIRSLAEPQEVVAYLPSDLAETPVLGHGSKSTNFTVTALTGLDGYFLSEDYSVAFAVPSLRGSDDSEVLAQAQKIYRQRRENFELFLNGDRDGSARLMHDHVCWAVLAGDALRNAATSTPKLWRRTRDIAVYRLCR